VVIRRGFESRGAVGNKNLSMGLFMTELEEKKFELSNRKFWWERFFDDDACHLVDRILIPKMPLILNEFGHDFTMTSQRSRYYGADDKYLTMIDLSFESNDEILIFRTEEVLVKSDVESLLGTLKLLREKCPSASLKEKTLRSAVAGVEIDDGAREMALDLGMYVVEMIEETEHVNVIRPSGELGKG
jgi:hypothetical protein